jgi:hypothetical protein
MTKTPQVGKPVKHGTGWLVPSGKVSYFVERLPDGRWRCTCPSHRFRQHLLCKHCMAVVRLRRQGVTMGD